MPAGQELTCPSVDSALLPLLIVVGVAAVAVVAGYQWWQRRQRATEAAALAARFGFQYSHGDVLGLRSLPFPLFERGDDRGVENLLWGTLGGEEVHLFDFWYLVETTDAKGNRSRRYERFSCAHLQVPFFCPRLTIGPEGLASRFADTIGVGRDIQFESEAFNRGFEVRATSRDFAFAVVDAGMMDWLLEQGRGVRFALFGNDLLLTSRQLPVEQTFTLGRTLAEFKRRIPRIVWSSYGPDRPAGG